MTFPSVRELVQTTSPAIQTLGAAFYFDPATLRRGRELNLDGFRFYVLGRGGVLGNVEPAVVTSAFGYFHPSVMEKIWTSARERLEPRTAAREYLQCCANWGETNLGGRDGLADFNNSAEAVISAVDPAGLALFAGLAAEPRAEGEAGRAAQNIAVLREHRGSVHLLAVIANGVAPGVAHASKRPNDTEAFGWAEPPEVSDDDRARLSAAEQMTEDLCLAPYAALTEPQRAAFGVVTDWV